MSLKCETCGVKDAEFRVRALGYQFDGILIGDFCLEHASVLIEEFNGILIGALEDLEAH